MKAALYARYSSDQQRDASIEDQIRLCTEHLAKQGLEPAECFSDYALSGSTLNRPGIQSLLSACQEGRFDLVVAEALDRLSRDQEDVAALYKRLSFQGVRLITLSEGEINELHVGLKGTMNSLFLKDLAAKTRRGLRGRVTQGKSGGGKAYGYDVVRHFAEDGLPVRGDRQINLNEAAVVERIFKDYAAGASPKAIALALNKEGVAGPSGRAWGPSTINGNRSRGTGILNNELYVGRLVWNRLRYLKDPDTGKRVSRLNPEEDWVVQDVPDLRIIDQGLWDQVKARQRELEGNRSGPKPFWDRRRPRYLLSGLVTCGICGGRFSMISKTHMGCSTARNKGTCDNRRTISRPHLEAYLLEGLQHHLMDPDLFEVFCREFHTELNRLRKTEQSTRRKQEQQLRQVEDGIRRLIEAIKNGVPPQTIKDEMIALEGKKASLKQALSEPVDDKPFVHPNMAKLYRQKVGDLASALREGPDHRGAFDRIRSLVEEVVLVPTEGSFAIEIKGDFAGILKLSSEGKLDRRLTPDRLKQLKLVAGAGFEPATFRL